MSKKVEHCYGESLKCFNLNNLINQMTTNCLCLIKFNGFIEISFLRKCQIRLNHLVQLSYAV